MRLHEFLKWDKNVDDRDYSFKSCGIFAFSPAEKYALRRNYSWAGISCNKTPRNVW